MEFQIDVAIIAGISGTVAMTALMYMGYLMNMRMDMPMMLGTMFLPRGSSAWALGLTMHLMMGAVFFAGYAALIAGLENESVVVWSVALGLVHGAVAGMAMGMMPAMHPRMATTHGSIGNDQVASPGLFATSFGLMGPIAILMLHAVFGLVGGLVYSA